MPVTGIIIAILVGVILEKWDYDPILRYVTMVNRIDAINIPNRRSYPIPSPYTITIAYQPSPSIPYTKVVGVGEWLHLGLV
jgi:hypothetical protein